jgi:hypothetical protein
MKQTTDPVAYHFTACLTVKERRDGNTVPGIAKGDCCIMLELIRMKLDDFGTQIDPANPGRFRGTAGLIGDMREVFGDLPVFHVPKWGASHVRGAFRDDTKRGNKRHLISLIDLLNNYRGDAKQLRVTYEKCIRAHHDYWEKFSIVVVVQKTDNTQERLVTLLSTPSYGRVQQGLVFSALKRRYGESKRITTKKTFAGDDQSSRGELVQRGDIQVWGDTGLEMAVEVKDAVVDQVAWGRVAPTHGAHDYALFVLAIGFHPGGLQREIMRYASTFALHIVDFMLSVVFVTAADEGEEPATVLLDILQIYNDVFVEQIEKDSSIAIKLVEQ